ncbi:MAG: thioredoxin family protein [Symbiobacteriia bacterium]
MPVLSEALRQMAAERLQGMVGPVTLCLSGEGEGLAALVTLARDLGVVNELVEYRTDCVPDTDGLTPSLRLLDGWGRETGVRYVGLPLGQEYPVLLNDLLAASRGNTSISPLGRAQARDLAGELMVFWTPNCPRCAQAVRLAHELAIEGPNLRVKAVDVTLHPELVARYGAQTVPFFVWEGRFAFPGPLPELVLLQRLQFASEEQN